MVANPASDGTLMTGFDEREKGEEARFKRDEELRFKARNRGNKLFGLWIAEQLGHTGDAAEHYARNVVMADFELPGDDDILKKVKVDLVANKVEVSDHLLEKHLAECRQMALEQIRAQ
jgi:hypothetical protein